MYTFCTAYWFNVRNDLRVNYWDAGNEPNLAFEGLVPIEDYKKYVQTISDAVRHVFSTYVPSRSPVVLGGVCAWPDAGYYTVLERDVPSAYDALSYHHYGYLPDLLDGVKTMHSFFDRDIPLWMTEWGTFTTFDSGWANTHNDHINAVVPWLTFALNACKPGSQHLDGWNYYMFFAGSIHDGLVYLDGHKTKMYHGLRMFIRGFQGGKPVYPVSSDETSINALASRDGPGDTVNLFMTNLNAHGGYDLQADLSALTTWSGPASMWLCNESNNDTRSDISVTSGRISAHLPAMSAALMRVPRASATRAGSDRRSFRAAEMNHPGMLRRCFDLRGATVHPASITTTRPRGAFVAVSGTDPVRMLLHPARP